MCSVYVALRWVLHNVKEAMRDAAWGRVGDGAYCGSVGPCLAAFARVGLYRRALDSDLFPAHVFRWTAQTALRGPPAWGRPESSPCLHDPRERMHACMYGQARAGYQDCRE